VVICNCQPRWLPGRQCATVAVTVGQPAHCTLTYRMMMLWQKVRPKLGTDAAADEHDADMLQSDHGISVCLHKSLQGQHATASVPRLGAPKLCEKAFAYAWHKLFVTDRTAAVPLETCIRTTVFCRADAEADWCLCKCNGVTMQCTEKVFSSQSTAHH